MTELSTLCYIFRGEDVLLLYRDKKENDLNEGKWIGVGGRFKDGESPEECLLREVKEETGLALRAYRFRALVTFVSGAGETEYMSLFTADAFEGEPGECDEGELRWVSWKDVPDLNLWEGDRIFLRLLAEEHPFFSLKLVYDGAGHLKEAVLDGQPIAI